MIKNTINAKTKMRKTVKKLSKQAKRKVTDIIINDQSSVVNENQSKIDFLKSLHSLQMGLSGVAKNLNGYGYKYQDFNEIVREIKNVIKTNNLDIGFVQCPTLKSFDGRLINVITTTFYSPSSGYSQSFDTPIYTEELTSAGVKNQNTLPQLVGSCITYFKRYALVAYLSIESEVDTDACSLEHRQEDNKEQVSIANNTSIKVVKGSRTVNVKSTNAKKTPIKGSVKTQSIGCKSVREGDELPKRVPSKYYYYKNLLQASKKMHSQLEDTPFDSLEMIDKFLYQLQEDDDSNILNYFETKPELKTVEYWTSLLNNYLTRTQSDPEVVEGFSKFLVYREPKYGQSPLKLFGYIASDENFRYLCE
ncbi:ERF family protein [Borrelia coriaceae]|uniref:ERF superfamily protein n=1 Tax=Borrelia coriaceae ATCC 43381 TaxID=1408429 RepID=W5T283_9SPIR|nr:ERF family protein [Borrelia coriaceae]AHH11396.1 ERF superfamily protein [Borrelia coriaceae ATCC 43381]